MKPKQLQQWYNKQIEQQLLKFDSAQLAIIQELDSFMASFKYQHKFFGVATIFSRLHKPVLQHHGYYLYGQVGRGKSMIINELYRLFPCAKKVRLHFHEFMSNIHQQLAKLKHEINPLTTVAKLTRKKYQIIFLDEMLVNDIASAMILNNLFNSLFTQGIYLVITSNNKPDDLYADELMRDRFLPAVTLMQRQLQVMCLTAVQDYRCLHDSDNQWFIISQADAHARLEEIFQQIAINTKQAAITDEAAHLVQDITVCSRTIVLVRRASNIIWFKFAIICGIERSQLDYLELVKHFDYFIIEDIIPLTDAKCDMVRRLILLIDILYDNHCKLALSSSVAINAIYPTGEYSSEFARTVSRLTEMQTKQYLV